jgi:hypothetical protein
MSASTNTRQRVLAELDAVPDEYLPFVLQVIRSFQDTVRLKPAAESLRQALLEARSGETHPVDTLWDDLDVNEGSRARSRSATPRAEPPPAFKEVPNDRL